MGGMGKLDFGDPWEGLVYFGEGLLIPHLPPILLVPVDVAFTCGVAQA